MPILKLFDAADKKLRKLNKKHHDMLSRYEKTKKAFDANHRDPKLDFKKHQGQKDVWKIQLLGPDDGRRLMLKPSSNKQTFHVFNILNHDRL